MYIMTNMHLYTQNQIGLHVDFRNSIRLAFCTTDLARLWKTQIQKLERGNRLSLQCPGWRAP